MASQPGRREIVERIYNSEESLVLSRNQQMLDYLRYSETAAKNIISNYNKIEGQKSKMVTLYFSAA